MCENIRDTLALDFSVFKNPKQKIIVLVEQQSLQNLAAAKVVQIIMFKFGFKASKYKINCKAQGTDLKIKLLWFDYPSVIF